MRYEHGAERTTYLGGPWYDINELPANVVRKIKRPTIAAGRYWITYSITYCIMSLTNIVIMGTCFVLVFFLHYSLYPLHFYINIIIIRSIIII